MKVAFFISDHGFGHLMRQLPVARELIGRGHDVVIVTGPRQGRYADRYLQGKEELHICNTDAGIEVVPGTLTIDRGATAECVRRHTDKWPQLMASAPDADVYAVDIVPWALLEAGERGIPSFLISNFTWMEQYEPFLPEELLGRYRSAFVRADRVLYLELANAPARKLLGDGTDVGFVCRPFDERKVAAIKDSHRNPIVFLSLGASNSGLDIDIDVTGLPYDFITTGSLKLKGDNVEYLPADADNTQDYVRASDYCIAKAGWSTVSEMMTAGVRSAFIERADTPEDTMTIAELKRRGDAVSVTADELKDMGYVLKKMESHEWRNKGYKNNYGYIADLITR